MSSATATVVRGLPPRVVKVSVPVVARNPSGGIRYEGEATATFVIPHGDPVPEFEIAVRVTTEEVSGG